MAFELGEKVLDLHCTACTLSPLGQHSPATAHISDQDRHHSDHRDAREPGERSPLHHAETRGRTGSRSASFRPLTAQQAARKSPNGPAGRGSLLGGPFTTPPPPPAGSRKQLAPHPARQEQPEGCRRAAWHHVCGTTGYQLVRLRPFAQVQCLTARPKRCQLLHRSAAAGLLSTEPAAALLLSFLCCFLRLCAAADPLPHTPALPCPDPSFYPPAPHPRAACLLVSSTHHMHCSRLPAAEEPQRYASLVRHLAAQWQRDKNELGVAAAAEATLPYVPLAKGCAPFHRFICCCALTAASVSPRGALGRARVVWTLC